MICWCPGGALPAQLPGTTLRSMLLIEEGGVRDDRCRLDRSCRKAAPGGAAPQRPRPSPHASGLAYKPDAAADRGLAAVHLAEGLTSTRDCLRDLYRKMQAHASVPAVAIPRDP